MLRSSRNVLDPSRDYLFELRLAGVLKSRCLASLDELVHLLIEKPDRELEEMIVDAMTINETSFFRDTRPFELLRTTLLEPMLDARRMTRRLRFWSAACSTGQEAYSLAILLREHFPHLANWNIRVEGTDLSAQVVQRAKLGRYHRIEINRGLPARCIPRFFDHEGDEWTVKPEVHGLCRFRQLNLCAANLPFPEPFDVVMIRNVLLYFDMPTRRAVLETVHKMLAPDGVMFMGSSEQPPDMSPWKVELAGGTCVYRPR